jgi:methionyl-tRNA synthetase
VDISKYAALYDSYEINKVCDDIWERITAADKYIQEHQPFRTIKTDKAKGEHEISHLLEEVAHIGVAPSCSDLTSRRQKKLLRLFLRN